MASAEFQVDIDAEAAERFAGLSGDRNPLHTDPEYAAGTRFKRPILHGAYLAGLVSRMAGMHLPGTACLLHSIRIRFVSPVQPPVRVTVSGTIVGDDGSAGLTRVAITDTSSGTLYAEAHYEFSRHTRTEPSSTQTPAERERPVPDAHGPPRILVTGASGALGGAVLEALGEDAVGVARSAGSGWIVAPDLEDLTELPIPARLAGIVHCAWPAPDNQRLLDVPVPREAVEHHVARPLRQIMALARLLTERGTPGAQLVLAGSTAAEPGRHNYRMPLYSVSKGMVPTLARILALELAPADRRCLAVTFDVIEGGMNAELSPRARIMNQDRSPFGRIPSPSEAADQIAWVLRNPGFLASGATLHLTGGALP